MYVTIRVRPSAHAKGDARVPSDLAIAAADLGLIIEPMHPGVVDDELSRYFQVDLADVGGAEAVAERLGQVPWSTPRTSSQLRDRHRVGAGRRERGDHGQTTGDTNARRPYDEPSEPFSPAELMCRAAHGRAARQRRQWHRGRGRGGCEQPLGKIP